MDPAAFSQLGVGLATLFILWLVVRYFIQAITRKDNWENGMVRSFNKTINNHIKHQTKATEKSTEAIEKNTAATQALVSVIGKFSDKMGK